MQRGNITEDLCFFFFFFKLTEKAEMKKYQCNSEFIALTSSKKLKS